MIPDFSYAMTLYLAGQAPNTSGLDPYTAMQAAVAYGLLPISLASFTTKTMGELYIANWKNYPTDQQNAALRYARKGVVSLPTWDAILDHLNRLRSGVSLHLHWYSNFMRVGSDGILQPPTGIFSEHNVAVYDCVEKDGQQYLLIKPWIGAAYGAGGYALLSREIYETIKVEAFGFDPYANRLIALMRITISKLLYLLKILRT